MLRAKRQSCWDATRCQNCFLSRTVFNIGVHILSEYSCSFALFWQFLIDLNVVVIIMKQCVQFIIVNCQQVTRFLHVILKSVGKKPKREKNCGSSLHAFVNSPCACSTCTDLHTCIRYRSQASYHLSLDCSSFSRIPTTAFAE